jgi:hypothetical protein
MITVFDAGGTMTRAGGVGLSVTVTAVAVHPVDKQAAVKRSAKSKLFFTHESDNAPAQFGRALYFFMCYFLKILAPKARVATNNTIKIKNRIFAIEAAPAAIPPNPKMAAIIAMIKNVTAQRNIVIEFKFKIKIKGRVV